MYINYLKSENCLKFISATEVDQQGTKYIQVYKQLNALPVREPK